LKDIKIKIINPLMGDSIPLPEYETQGSAGLDLRACLEGKLILKAKTSQLIPIGFAMYLEDPGLAALVVPRSGLGSKHGIVLGNLVGLIDSDYQGELMVPAWNRSEKDFEISPGDRIAQMIIVPVIQARFKVVESFEESLRGEKGFWKFWYKLINLFFLAKSFFKLLNSSACINNFLFTSIKRMRRR
jgi:dUTP pyrophosphatase